MTTLAVTVFTLIFGAVCGILGYFIGLQHGVLFKKEDE